MPKVFPAKVVAHKPSVAEHIRTSAALGVSGRHREAGLRNSYGPVPSVTGGVALIFVSMRLTSVKAIYSHLAKTYDCDLRDAMNYTAHVEVPRLIVDALGSRRANVLDLGCGTGLSSLVFFEQGYDVTGIDGVGAMVRRARKLPYKKVIQQDLESPWRVKDQSFDAAVMIGVMEYIIYPQVLLRQVRDKLVPGGVFGLTVPRKNKLYEQDGLKSYYAKEIVPVIDKAGFEVMMSEKTLGYQDQGRKIMYWNYLLRRPTL
jgi:predicted TPR repeat methyltransferase